MFALKEPAPARGPMGAKTGSGMFFKISGGRKGHKWRNETGQDIGNPEAECKQSHVPELQCPVTRGLLK